MKDIIITILTILLVPIAPIVAQHDGGNLNYVAGEEYKVTNQNGGFTIEWNQQPAPPEQIRSVSEEEMVVLNPDGEERLIITVNEDGTFKEVIDLKYQNREIYYARKARNAEYRRRDAERAQRDAARSKRDAEYTKRDAEYAKRDAEYARRDAERAQKELDFWKTKREFTFENGLKITIENQLAKATYLGKALDVIGGQGRWRVETDEFEAGVAYGPGYGDKAYQYLKPKSDDQ